MGQLATIPPSAFALIIGAMKSGTSFLYQYVQRHPHICSCRVKEPEFFAKHHKGPIEHIEHYEMLWDYDPVEHAYCLEASTGYSKYPIEKNVAANIFNYGLRPKIIYIVRHPLNRVLSQYNFVRFTLDPGAEESPLHDRFLSASRYFLQLSQYLKYFPDKRDYLILDFDKIKHAPDDLVNEVFAFLNVEPIGMTGGYEVVLKTPNRTKLEQALQRTQVLQRIKDRVPAGVKRVARTVATGVSDSAQKTFTAEEEVILRERLYDDMKRLKEEFGFNVAKWGF